MVSPVEYNRSTQLKLVGQYGESRVQVTSGMQNCQFGKRVFLVALFPFILVDGAFAVVKFSQLQLSHKRMEGTTLIVQVEYLKNALVLRKRAMH